MSDLIQQIASDAVSGYMQIILFPIVVASWKILVIEQVVEFCVDFVLQNTEFKYHDELNDIANRFDDIVSRVSEPLEMDLLIGRFGLEIIIKNLSTAEVYFTDRITYNCLQVLYEAAFYWQVFAYLRSVSIDYTYQ